MNQQEICDRTEKKHEVAVNVISILSANLDPTRAFMPLNASEIGLSHTL